METIRPYDWQRPVIEKQTKALREHRFCLNACCTGAGKTVLALQSAKDLNAPTLVITPLVAHKQWRDTAEAMGCADLLLDVINIEKINASKTCRWYNEENNWSVPEGTLVILDECHRGTSGPESKATKAFAILKAYRSVRLLALSATAMVSPLQGRLIGFWSGLHSFNKYSFYAWCNANGCGMDYIGWGRNRKQIYRFTTNVNAARGHMAKIRKDLGDMFISMGPKEIPGFPDETVEIERIDLSTRDQKKLEEMKRRMPPEYFDFGKLDDEDMPDDRLVTLRLRQQAEFMKAYAMADEAVAHVMQDKSVAVFLNFKGPRFIFEERLRDAKIPFISIYGGQDKKEREDGIDRFQRNEAYVAVCMMQAAGCAVSLHDKLHERARVALISPGYDASQVKQSLGRTRRVGGTQAHQIFCLCNGIEDRVYKTLQRKVAALDSLNDGDLEL